MANNISFIVVNGCQAPITNVYVVHEEDQIVAHADSLEPGKAIPPKSISSSGTDNWDISFELNGQLLMRHGKECGIYDEDSSQVTVISLYPDNFSVCTPQSKGCYCNDYFTSGTGAVATFYNQSPANITTSILSETEMNASLYYFHKLEIPAFGNSAGNYIQASPGTSQSVFDLQVVGTLMGTSCDTFASPPDANPNLNGDMSLNLGTAPAFDTAVNWIHGSPSLGALLAPNPPVLDGPSYDFYLFASPGTLPPFINSVIEANVPAIENALAADNPLSIKVSDIFSLSIDSFEGLDSITCSYAAVQYDQDQNLDFTIIISASDRVTASGSMTFMGNTAKLADAWIEGLQIMLQGNATLAESGQLQQVCMTNVKFTLTDYDIDFGALEVIFPGLAAVSTIFTTFATGPDLAGLANKDCSYLGEDVSWNSEILAAINSALSNYGLGGCSGS